MKPPLQVETIDDGRVVVLRLAGVIDSNSAGAFQTPLIAAVSLPDRRVELDLGDVEFISSAGLRVLLIAAKRLASRGERLSLTRLKPYVRGTLELANFGLFLDFEPQR